MPFVTIYGTPQEIAQEELENLMQKILRAVNDFTAMNYREKDLMVWFPSDRMAKGLGHEFSIEAVGIDSSRQQGYSSGKADAFALLLCKIVASFFPQYWRIECYVRRYTAHDDGDAILTQPPEGGT